jgi:hypothetical protein
MLTRQQFADYFNSVKPDLGNDDSPLWIPESDDIIKCQCQWFVNVKPLRLHHAYKYSYWVWLRNNLKGEVRCYSSDYDNQEEWWGFTHKEDIVWWILRWS